MTVNQNSDNSTWNRFRKKRKKPLRDIQLPHGLQEKVGKQYLTAVVMTIAIIILAIYYRSPSHLFGIVIPVALIYLGINTTYDFDDGNIEELAVVCTSVNTYKMRDTTHVVFRTEDNPPKYFSFIIPGKHEADKLIPNSSYVIYFNSDHPESLLGYVQL